MTAAKTAWTAVGLSTLLVAGACYKQVPNDPVQSEKTAVEESEKDIVSFKFGWKDGQTIRANTVQTVHKNGQKQSEVSTSYTISAKALGSSIEKTEGQTDMRVGFDPDIEGLNAGTRQSLATVINAASLSALPDLVVTPKGTIKAIENLEAVRAEFEAAAKKAAGSSQLSPRLTKILGQLLDDQTLKNRARQRWDVLVGMWASDQFEVGETYSSKAEDVFAFPIVGEKKVRMEVKFGVKERVSCGSAGEGKCVRIELNSRPDIRKMKEVMQAWVDEFSKQQAKEEGMQNVPKLTVENVYLQTDTTVVTDPKTLLPTEMTQKKTTRLTLSAPNGEEQVVRSVDEIKTSYQN